jgi:hypothetical protein
MAKLHLKPMPPVLGSSPRDAPSDSVDVRGQLPAGWVAEDLQTRSAATGESRQGLG